ncbi:Tat pathway signal protein [Streptomyces sp. NPDC057638]|uniref:Tat pathway signal protein n=1 Tax=Streptomyces sp. NPDC057638 TaxID=3346190 RepID=UPI0036BF3692
MARTRNEALAAVIREIGWSQEQTARNFRITAAENGATDLTTVTRSHVSQWVLGSHPQEAAARILVETLSRGAGRTLTFAEIGLIPPARTGPAAHDWSTDTRHLLLELGETDMDLERRQILATGAYSLAALALPDETWWDTAPARAAARRTPSNAPVSATDVDSVREMAGFFSQRDQKRGGADGRTALIAYLRTDLTNHLNRPATSENIRRDLYSAAAEMTYIAGWTAFDSREHTVAQHYFTLAVRLAAEADDAPLAGHVLRAMAHQAADLGHGRQAVTLATASLGRGRYTRATPRERALLGVVHARALAADGQRREALAALRRAEDDLTNASAVGSGDDPQRVFFFGEASLAHETACTLRQLGDLDAAETHFRRSIRTRRKDTFRRTHSVTLGYLGALQAQRGHLDAACATWSEALTAMDGVHSGRARDTVIQMRRALSPIRARGGSAVTELDDRARTALGRIS